MNWTIKTKMIAMGLLVFAGLAGLGTLALSTNKTTEEGVAELVRAVRADLVGLVEKRVSAVDDTVDNRAGEVGEKLDRMLASVNGEVEEAGAAMIEELADANIRLAVIFFLTLAVIIPSFVFFARGIVIPLRRTGAMVGEMAKGHLDSRLDLKSADEVGQMARAMDGFAESLQNEVVAALRKLAEGDLTISAEPKDDRDMIRTALSKVGEDLNALIAQVLVAGEQIASNSSQVADSSQSLSQGATESASSLEQITSSMAEMASQTKLNAENATQANVLSGQVREAAASGNAQMIDMIEAMGEINDSSQNISKIIKTIDEIAFQTNLLALNAAVEAARAGKHGKGFAVVAEEVRNLAARSAKAASETADLIEGSVQKVAAGAGIADKTAEALGEIVTGVGKVTDLVAEIAAASNEQAQGIGQVNQGLSQIDKVTQQNTANAEQSASASEELSGQAEQLQRMLSRFTLKGGGQKVSGGVTFEQPRPAGPSEEVLWGGGAPVGYPPPPQDPSAVIALDEGEFGKY